MALSPTFVFDYESNMRTITENEYARISSELWYQKVTKQLPSKSARERLAWLISSARIETQDQGGNMNFEELAAITTEYQNRNAGNSIRIDENQLKDLDGSGLQQAAKWSGDMGNYMAYWPQEKVSQLILNGGASTSLTYDGIPFFSKLHPYNQFIPGSALQANDFTGSASGSYPGACPIDATVTLDVALTNLNKAIGYIRSLKMPNGITPRFLKPAWIAGAPNLFPRIVQLTNARILAQAAAGGAGSGDVEAVITNMGLGTPQMIAEFSANTTYQLDKQDGGGSVSGSDTTYYIAVEEIGSTELGALTYIEREPFGIQYYTGDSGANADLSRINAVEYHCKGRNVTGYGHPYLLFRCQGT